MDPATSNRLVAVLRRPDGLFAVVSARQAPFERPLPPRDGERAAALPPEGPYAETLRPLATVPEQWLQRRKSLLRSWEALRSVQTLNAGVSANVLIVLLETVPDPAADVSTVPPLGLDETPPPLRPTAAHPRAYRGTKYQPPKRSRARPLDLRPHLCVARDEERLLARLAPHFEDAVTRLARAHPFADVLRDRGPQVLKPYAQLWEPRHSKQIAALPAPFRRYCLWNLRACDWPRIGTALAAYWALELERDKPLRRCISALLAVSPALPSLVQWCQVVVRMPPERRVRFTELLIESGAWRETPTTAICKGLLEADALAADDVYGHRMFHALSSVGEKCDLAYANAGFALANEFLPAYEFDRVGSVTGAAASIRRLAAHARSTHYWGPASPLLFWERCAELKGFKELLDTLAWQRLAPEEAVRFLGLFTSVVYGDLEPDALRERWQLLRKRAPGLLAWLLEIAPPYRLKAIRHLEELVWTWDDTDGLAAILESYPRLLRRLCAPPFAPDGHNEDALTDLSFIQGGLWPEVERAPDESFLKLEAATRRQNDSWLIGRGLRSLVHQWPQFAVAALRRFPAKLATVAHTLGVMDSVRRDRVLTSFRAHPLASTDVSVADISSLVRVLDEHTRPGFMNPVSKRLREHLRGGRSLKPAQIERDAALVRENWLGVQLDTLSQLAVDQMAQGFPAAERSSKVRHALMIQQFAAEHRRGLRRLLNAYLRGDMAYAEKHPSNRAWLAKHPRIDAAKWLEGLRYRRDVPGLGVLTLAIERDALEVLRMGTYFGTCLGLGGGLSYSAAAVALDINKQVVYARSAGGRVVARQLLAISEDNRLICFSVYPKGAAAKIRRLFKEFDLQLAAHLNVQVHRQADDGDGEHYKIAAVLSRDFWDDFAWDLRVTSSNRIRNGKRSGAAARSRSMPR